MFKIDWATAIGGALVGYYTKSKVEDAKSRFKRICTTTVESLKDSLQNQNGNQNQNGQKNG